MSAKKMSKKDAESFFNGCDEVELTEDLIREIVQKRLWGDVKSLTEMKTLGAKWNTKRNSLVLPSDFF